MTKMSKNKTLVAERRYFLTLFVIIRLDVFFRTRACAPARCARTESRKITNEAANLAGANLSSTALG